MSLSVLDQTIIETVESHQGLKATELTMRVIELLFQRLPPREVSEATENLVERIFHLIEEGELRGVNYVLPTLCFREKTFVLPKETRIEIAA